MFSIRNDENFIFGVNNRKFHVSLATPLQRQDSRNSLLECHERVGRLEVRLPMEAYKEQLKIQA